MNYWFLVKCYFVGILAASGIGPIFVLTFNRGAIHGFLRGFATAVGAALGDSLFFFLSLMGILATFEDSKRFMILLDLVGGLILVYLGMRILRKKQGAPEVRVGHRENIMITMSRSFVLTVVNPLTVLFFMLIAVKILPDGRGDFSLGFVLLSSLMLALGSLTVLTIVSLVASMVGHLIRKPALHFISLLTSGVFFSVGIYLLFRFIYVVFNG